MHFRHSVCSPTGRFEFEENVTVFSYLFLMMHIVCFLFFFLFASFLHRIGGTAGGYGVLCSQAALFLLTQYCAQTD